MKKYGIIILALVIALGLGLTVTDVWSYILDFVKLVCSYGLELVNAVFDALRAGINNVMNGESSVVTTVVETTTALLQ